MRAINTFHRNKKGELTIMQLVAGVIGLVILVVALVVGGKILSQVQDTQTAGSVEANISAQGLSALADFGDWLPIIVVILVAGFIIGFLLVQFFRGRQ